MAINSVTSLHTMYIVLGTAGDSGAWNSLPDAIGRSSSPAINQSIIDLLNSYQTACAEYRTKYT